MKIILASGSPRRREILSNLGLNFEVETADVNEDSVQTDPAALVRELACRKAAAVAELRVRRGESAQKTLIIAADTVVCVDGVILGKPRDREDARAMLRRLSGREHDVFTGLCLIYEGRAVSDVGHTAVEFDTMTEQQIADYVATGEPDDKAGAYAVQGRSSAFIRGLRGCYFNVMGLPVHLLYRLCRDEYGIDLMGK